MVKVGLVKRTMVEVPQYFRQVNGRSVAVSVDGQRIRYVYEYGGVGSISSEDGLSQKDLDGIVEISRDEYNEAVMEFINREILVGENGF